ncbi:MAG: hypothetical protein NTX65_04960 [Ignavibacteriales bacterium]|nr:hypothetical protein [Ignavibacteriales bacterium]
MEKVYSQEIPSFEMDSMPIQNDFFRTAMGHRVCDNCGEEKDISGGKSCSKGHFICHSCSSRHVHCPLCGHTLR